MHKMKSILHSSGRKRAQSSAHQADEHGRATNPRGEQHTADHGERDRSTSGGSQDGAPHTASTRPLAPAYDARRAGNPSQSAAAHRAQPNPSDSNSSIANTYKAYLPVLSSADDSKNEQHMTLGADRRLIAAEDDAHGRHEEDVADRNINRYSASLDAGQGKALPKLPDSTDADQDGLRRSNNHRKQSLGTGPFDSTIRTVPSDASANQPHSSSLSARPAHDESQFSGSNTARGSQLDDDVAQPPQGSPSLQDLPLRQRGERTDASTAVTDGPLDRDGQSNWKEQQKELLRGVVDLRNTVDTDRNVKVAPAVTHETIKPHEHEIIQHQLHREIHNYSYYHRLQPVIHTEVLPPRHFIPNPNGEGLIEISADELPTRTGENRWWDISQRVLPQPETPYRPRTAPEVIEGKTYMTEEGFERKETTILYPPTLEDMEGYGGPIQPVHFDHKTGERWLGEVTTVDKLTEESSHVPDPDTMKFNELRESLPDVAPSPTIKRKPVDW